VVCARSPARVTWADRHQAAGDRRFLAGRRGRLAARADWGFAPRYDFERAFAEYLIPTIRERYAVAPAPRST
jgi:hypothetical protein